MDFARTFGDVSAFLATEGFPCAVIGGVALAALGHPRMTLDLDLVTHADAQNAVVAYMVSQGFETLHRSAGYSNHVHADRMRGRVDFMYIRGETASRVFGGLRQAAGPGGAVVDVPRPEHLVAMKVAAMKDAPERRWQDMADIGFLVTLPGVDRDEVRGYFERHQLGELWRELERGL